MGSSAVGPLFIRTGRPSGRSAAGGDPDRVLSSPVPPFAENDTWWGPGYTEWTSVAAARPLFRGHQQPNLPGRLGFYDLRLAETRADQASLARNAGVHGFCGLVIRDSSPVLFEAQLRHAVTLVDDRAAGRRIVFLKSWNEWSEGSYVEPDRRMGEGYLAAIRRVLRPHRVAVNVMAVSGG